jgi:DNA-binding transcriptional regulator GbsR (MarR family)
MNNIQAMSPAQLQFIEDLGQNMVGWGLSRTTGRVYAYLLVQSRPATLDEIAEDLTIAKSGASVATRQLTVMGMVRAAGQQGSRRLLYEALYDPEAIVAARAHGIREFLNHIRQGADVMSTGSQHDRLHQMASELQELYGEMPVLARRIIKRRRSWKARIA